MTVEAAGRRMAASASAVVQPRLRDVYRVEVAKLWGQLLVRLIAVACLVGPLLFVIILKSQSAVPADTLFGRWTKSSGFAVPLFLLGVGGQGGFLLLVSIVAGDAFAAEDRHGTWQTLLTRSCTRAGLFVGKVLAAATYSAAAVTVLAVTSLAAGVLLVGTRPLIGLSGAQLGAGRSVLLIVASWGSALLPVLGFTAVGVLFSVATRNSVMGVLGVLVTGLLMQLLSVLGFRTLMLTTPFDAWHGLFARPPYLAPLGQGAAVALGYVVVSLALAWVLFRHRDFAGTGSKAGWRLDRPLLIRVAAASVAFVALLGAASYRPSPITPDRLAGEMSSMFGTLVEVKSSLVGHPVSLKRHPLPLSDPLRIVTRCERGGGTGPALGPGDDWICGLTVVLSDRVALPVTYEVSVKSNGCFTADGASSVVGPLLVRDAEGHPAVNPLYIFDGCVNTP